MIILHVPVPVTGSIGIRKLMMKKSFLVAAVIVANAVETAANATLHF